MEKESVMNRVFDIMDDDGTINQLRDNRLTWCELDTFINVLKIDWNFTGENPTIIFFDKEDKEYMSKQDLENLYELMVGDKLCM